MCVCLSVCSTVNEYRVVKTPAFAESVSEGDVKWEKGTSLLTQGNEVLHL